jgi:hypothetical protein
MPITRATNLAGLGTIFDSLTDGGGLSVSGISTFTDLNITRVNITGVGTISNGSITNLTGTSSTITTLRSTTLNADTGNIVTGVTTNFTSTNGSITNLTGTAGTVTTLRSTTGNFTTGNIVTGVTTNFTSTNVVITGVTTVAAGTAAAPSISPSGDPNTGVFFPSADHLNFSTGGTSRVQIDSDGDINIDGGGVFYDATNNRLAIGATTPGANLQIGDGSSATLGSTAPYAWVSARAGSQGGAATTPQELLRLSWQEGNQGLGVGEGCAINFAASLIGDSGTFYPVASIASFKETGSDSVRTSALTFSTSADGTAAPTERMRISSGGYLKATSDNENISYYSHATTLHHFQTNATEFTQAVVNAHESNPYGISIVFAEAAPDNNTNMFLQCVDNASGGTVRMRIYSDGDVQTSDAGTLTSDVTLKRDITDATPKLADVMNLQVRNFYWREDYHPNKQDKKLIGFIAQEFEQVFPGMISEHLISGGKPILDEDGNETGEKTPEVYKKGIKEGKLIPILVKALQESVARIETLEARLTAAGI